MKKQKAFRFRLYPNNEQQTMFAKTFGCTRFVYNHMLSDKIAYYKECGKTLNTTPAQYKEAFPWLKEVDSMALCNAQMNLQKAYKNFFDRSEVGFPKFRSKHHSRMAYTTNMINGNIRIIDGKYLKLPKLSPVRMKMHRDIPSGYAIKSVTVSKEPSGKYFASILTEYESESPDIVLDLEKSIGLDYSSPSFYVDNTGKAANMPHFYRKAEKKLAREQRRLSHMVRGSKNYQKQKVLVARIHEHIRNQRQDWQRKKAKELADSFDIVCLEDINYKGMAGSLNLGKSTHDNGFGQFRTLLTQKMEDQGKKVITIDKWFPSSKTCRFCKNKNKNLKLSDREWVCPSCGMHLNRDENAAIQIRTEGLALLVQEKSA